jgi:pimeloyl-ACP methyl ester carboxylesterase
VEELELVVGDLRFRAMAEGPEDGELVLLLHGFPQTWWEWRHQLRALGAAGYRAVAPDQRGYSPGARPEGVEAYHVDRLVEDVFGMADALEADRFHLVGHDWGAIVAWHAAGARPDRLRTLTIVSVPHPAAFARALADPASEQATKSQYIAGFQEPGAGAGMVADEGAGLRFAFQASGLDDDVDEHVRVLTQPGAIELALNWYRAFDFHGGVLGPITVPTLFVWSDDDIAIAREGATWTADHVDAPYRFVALEGGVPHWIPEVEADRLSELLLEQVAG